MKEKPRFFKSYAFSLLLLVSITLGAGLGFILGPRSVQVKPFGDLFLNLLFTAVVPLVFFSLSSAIAGMPDLRRLGKILFWMILIFILTGVISSLLMVLGVTVYPPCVGVKLSLGVQVPNQVKTAEEILKAFAVPDFFELLSKKNMLALIVFSLLTGLAASLSGSKGKVFSDFLVAGNEVMQKLIHLIMLYAPIGLGAYFAYLIGVFGPELFGAYVKTVALYYPLSIAYFFIGFTFYAWLAGGREAVRRFWPEIIPASVTALGTGSSIAAIPANLQAAERIGVPEDIREIVIPIGATIHMDGTCLAAILKISLLFSFFGMSFSGAGTIMTAVGIALLSGVVMSGIPGGGFLGELLIVTLYGFPPEVLPMISMVGTLVDPPATMVNSVGDNVAGMMVTRIVSGRHWMKRRSPEA